MLVSDSNHWWKILAVKAKCLGHEGNSSWTNQNSAWFTESKRNWQNGKDKKGEKYNLFIFLPFLKGWQRQCSNTDNKLYCSFPRAVAWLFGWSWNGQDQRDWKSTANNILNRLPPCDISAVAWGCVLQTFNVCACMRVDTNASVYVHRSGTSRILSLAVKIFTFAVGTKPWGRGHEQVWHKIFPISDQKAPHKAQSWRLDFVLQWHRPSWSEQRVDIVMGTSGAVFTANYWTPAKKIKNKTKQTCLPESRWYVSHVTQHSTLSWRALFGLLVKTRLTVTKLRLHVDSREEIGINIKLL